MTSHICRNIKRNDTNERIYQKKETDLTELDNELIVARGKDSGGGIVGELGIDIIYCYI